MNTAHYKIINKTKIPGTRKGKHRLGFKVDVLKGRPMGPGQHVIVEKITPGIMGMHRKGYIGIEEIKDYTVEVKKDLMEIQAENDKKTKETLAQAKVDRQKEVGIAKTKAESERQAVESSKATVPVSSLDKTAMKEQIKRQQTNTMTGAKVSGPESGVDPLADIEEAINPDGEPNFVVTAGKRRTKRK